jgi:hypothetical protein
MKARPLYGHCLEPLLRKGGVPLRAAAAALLREMME